MPTFKRLQQWMHLSIRCPADGPRNSRQDSGNSLFQRGDRRRLFVPCYGGVLLTVQQPNSFRCRLEIQGIDRFDGEVDFESAQ